MAKKSTFQLLFLLNWAVLLGQNLNWQPFPVNDQYTFRHSDSVQITHLFFVDSTVGDTYFFNRIVGDCDTCFFPSKLFNRPQFLLKKATRQTDSSWVFESDSEQFLLKPSAPVGSEWLFDSAKNTSAKVVEEKTIQHFGSADLLKIIELSDGKVIHLTLNKGIIRVPDFKNGGYFELIGIPSLNLGEKIPGVFDFFNFAVGDVFEFTGDRALDAGTPSSIFSQRKLTVLEKFWEGDSLVYKFRRSIQTIYNWSGGATSKFADTDTFFQKIHPAFFEGWVENGYPNQYFALQDLIFPGQFAARVGLAQLPFFGLTKFVGEFTESFQPRCNVFEQFENTQNEVLRCDQCFSFHQAFAVGLGQVSFDAACFEAWQSERLTGFVKNGDTTGIVSPDWVFTRTDEPRAEVDFNILPNPTRDDWQIIFQKPLPNVVKVLIFNNLGMMVGQMNLPSGAAVSNISAAHLPSGLYSIQLIGEGVFAQRFALKL